MLPIGEATRNRDQLLLALLLILLLIIPYRKHII